MIAVLVGAIIMVIFHNFESEWAAIFVALIIGVIGLFQSFIQKKVLPPKLEIIIKKSEASEIFTINGRPYKFSYNLSIRNYGFSTAKMLRAKIREKENVSWLHLRRSFFSSEKIFDSAGEIYINNLCPGEEDGFLLCFLESSNRSFLLNVGILLSPNNQDIEVQCDQTKEFFLEVVGENIGRISRKLRFENKNGDIIVSAHKA